MNEKVDNCMKNIWQFNLVRILTAVIWKDCFYFALQGTTFGSKCRRQLIKRMPILTCDSDNTIYFTKKNDYNSCVTQQLLALLKGDFGFGFDLDFYSQYGYCLLDVFGGLDFPNIKPNIQIWIHITLYLPILKQIKSFRVWTSIFV